MESPSEHLEYMFYIKKNRLNYEMIIYSFFHFYPHLDIVGNTEGHVFQFLQCF